MGFPERVVKQMVNFRVLSSKWHKTRLWPTFVGSSVVKLGGAASLLERSVHRCRVMALHRYTLCSHCCWYTICHFVKDPLSGRVSIACCAVASASLYPCKVGKCHLPHFPDCRLRDSRKPGTEVWIAQNCRGSCGCAVASADSQMGLL